MKLYPDTTCCLASFIHELSNKGKKPLIIFLVDAKLSLSYYFGSNTWYPPVIGNCGSIDFVSVSDYFFGFKSTFTPFFFMYDIDGD